MRIRSRVRDGGLPGNFGSFTSRLLLEAVKMYVSILAPRTFRNPPRVTHQTDSHQTFQTFSTMFEDTSRGFYFEIGPCVVAVQAKEWRLANIQFFSFFSGNNWEEQFGFFVGCSRPNLVVLHSTSNILKLSTESKKLRRGLDKLSGRKSTLPGENIPPQCRKYSFKIGGENLLVIYFALPVGSYKTISALEKIQLKWY